MDEYYNRMKELCKQEVYGDNNKLPLPFVTKTALPTPPKEIPVWPQIIPEACGTKIIIGGVTGYVMGVAIGAFMGSMGGAESSIEIIQGREVPQAPLREQMRQGFKQLSSKSFGMGRTFGVLSALFGGVECVIEKYRAKHDGWNPVISGCIVGGTLSAKGGPTAACIGCAGFAGFSFAVDRIMGH